MRQQRSGQADGTEQVGSDDTLGIGQIVLLTKKLLAAHDACVVDEHVYRWNLGDGFGGKGPQRRSILDIDGERFHAEVSGEGLVENMRASAGDDDLVALGVESLSESAANARTAARK